MNISSFYSSQSNCPVRAIFASILVELNTKPKDLASRVVVRNNKSIPNSILAAHSCDIWCKRSKYYKKQKVGSLPGHKLHNRTNYYINIR
jgi:hypothetical protein